MPDRHSTLATIAFLLVVALLGLAFLWGVAKVLPALGLAFGMAGAAFTAGLAGGVGVAGWIPVVAGAGAAAAAGGVAIHVFHRIYVAAEKERFSWIAPLVALIAAALVATATEYYKGPPIGKVAIGALAAALVLAGGVLFRSRVLGNRIMGGVLLLGPAILILGVVLTLGGETTLAADLAETSPLVWASVAAVTGLCVWLMWFAHNEP